MFFGVHLEYPAAPILDSFLEEEILCSNILGLRNDLGRGDGGNASIVILKYLGLHPNWGVLFQTHVLLDLLNNISAEKYGTFLALRCKEFLSWLMLEPSVSVA